MAKLFGHNNPNHKIFIVPTEEGYDSDDNMNSMIGDATMHHVDKLNPAERQLWEQLIIMGNSNIFEVTPNFSDNDHDPLNLRQKELENFFKYNSIPESAQVLYREAIEAEEERRNASEDAYDRTEMLISWDDWQNNPGLGQHVDLPTTPKPITRYMGNTTQMFYDEFPEGHQDSNLINQILTMLNKDIDDITEKYGRLLKMIIGSTKSRPYTQKYLTLLVDKLVEGANNPDKEVRITLRSIDAAWAKEYKAKSIKQAKDNGMTQILMLKYEEWEKRHKEGENLSADVRSFGKILWEQFHTEMKNYHWQMYARLKRRFAAKVMIKGIDINRCRYSELEKVLGVKREDAMRLWFERPWTNMYEVENEGIKLFSTDNTSVVKVMNLITLTAQKVKSTKDRTLLKGLADSLIRAQKSEKNNLSNIQWNSIWQHYRSTKEDLFQKAEDNG
jgi:hypothetical protein